MAYSTLKSRVSFPNGGCGMVLFPTVDVDQLCPLAKNQPSWPSLMEGQGVSVDPHWSTGPPLLDS